MGKNIKIPQEVLAHEEKALNKAFEPYNKEKSETFKTLAIPVFDPERENSKDILVQLSAKIPVIIFLNIKEASAFCKKENDKRKVSGKKLLFWVNSTLELPIDSKSLGSKKNQLTLF